jgi:site-specific DNA-cytosine methylase
MLKYCEIHRPGIVLLENVKAIEDSDGRSGSNADDCIELLEELGYMVVTVQLSPRGHGVPHRRRRL